MESHLGIADRVERRYLYKKRIMKMLPLVRQGFGYDWLDGRAGHTLMDADLKKQLEETVRSYVAQLDTELAATPFGLHLAGAYGNNRADYTFIPGGVIPGYIIIKPNFPECIDDFGFLWFEDEYVIDSASRWILAANAADALAK